MAVLRDHYEGTPYDATDGYKTGTPNRTKFRTICTASTINAFVVSLDAKRPGPLSTSIWLALGKPDTTVFLPLYYGVENLPAGAGLGTTTHDYELLYKQHFEDAEFKAAKGEFLNTKVLELEKAAEANYGPMRATLEKELFPAEKAFIEGRPKFEKDFTALYAKDKAKALKKLDAYVAAAFKKAAELTSRVLAKVSGS
jgi:dipeptidase